MKETLKDDTSGILSVCHACVAVAVFFAALLLLNGKGLYEGIGKQAFGARRDLLLKVAGPLKAVSEASGLCGLRDAAEATLGSWLNGGE